MRNKAKWMVPKSVYQRAHQVVESFENEGYQKMMVYSAILHQIANRFVKPEDDEFHTEFTLICDSIKSLSVSIRDINHRMKAMETQCEDAAGIEPNIEHPL